MPKYIKKPCHICGEISSDKKKPEDTNPNVPLKWDGKNKVWISPCKNNSTLSQTCRDYRPEVFEKCDKEIVRVCEACKKFCIEIRDEHRVDGKQTCWVAHFAELLRARKCLIAELAEVFNAEFKEL